MNITTTIAFVTLTGCAVVSPATSRQAPGNDGSPPGGASDAGVSLVLGMVANPPAGGSPTGDTGVPSGGTSGSGGQPIETVDAEGTPLRFTSAEAEVRHIELDLPGSERCQDLAATFTFIPPVRCESGEDKVEIVGPFSVDLVAGTATPSLDGLTIPALVYRRVDVRLDGTAADRITLSLGGTADLPNGPITFDVALEVDEDLRFESPTGVPVDGQTSLLAMLDADVVFARTSLGACVERLAEDGHATVDNTSECGDQLEDDIEDALKDSFDLD